MQINGTDLSLRCSSCFFVFLRSFEEVLTYFHSTSDFFKVLKWDLKLSGAFCLLVGWKIRWDFFLLKSQASTSLELFK